jgi:putative mRNA 3-end processing factor
MQEELDFIEFILAEKNKQSYDEKKISKDLLEIYSEIEEYQKKKDDHYYICENINILKIFQSSWLDENAQLSENMFYYLVGLYVLDCINLETYRSGIQEFFFNKSLSNKQILAAARIYFEAKENKHKNKLSYLSYLEFCREMGIASFSYKIFSKEIKEMFPEIKISEEEENIGREIDRCVKNLRERKEYVEEVAGLVSADVINFLDHYLEREILDKVSYNIAKNYSSQVKITEKISLVDFQKKIEEVYKKEKFPAFPTVIDPILHPHISKLNAKTVKMEDLANLPQDQVKEFASIKAYSSPSIAQKIRITFLGGGNIGNMGIIVQIDNNAILLDYGMSVANNSIPKWHPSLNFVKAVLLTHAHLDHSGALPYLITPENGKRWYASPITKILTEKLLFNTSNVVKDRNRKKIKFLPILKSYTKASRLVNLFNVCNPLKAKESVEISPGFEVTPYPASHLFGSYSYELNIFGKRILFTGDFSLDKNELFPGAKLPTDCDVTIFDGTYYNRDIPQEDPNVVLMQAAESCSRLIIPAFSLGRTQEMIKRLERLRISKKMNVKTTGLAADITRTMGINDGYKSYNSISPDDFGEGDIIVGGHGMVQGGCSRELVEATKEDEKTGIVICGYQAPNTLGYALKTLHPLATQNFKQKIFNAHISGHSSPQSLNEFINKIKGDKIMVHTPKNTKALNKHRISIPKYNQEFIFKIQ